MKKPLPTPSILTRNKAQLVRIHEVDFPLSTLDIEELKANCVAPVYEPAVVPMGEESVVLKSLSGKSAQVLVAHAPGLSGAECLIIRETAAALDALRRDMEVMRKGLRACLQLSEALADHGAIGQDAKTAGQLRELKVGAESLRRAFFPDDAPGDEPS